MLVIDICLKDRSYVQDKLPNPVVIMAGGLWKRLPHTSDCPKPMLKVGDKPILEIILLSVFYGLEEFYISVNYLKERIVDYLYILILNIFMSQRMGTAGSMNYLPK